MFKKFDRGDLVKFVRNPLANPPYIIPKYNNAVGIVHSTKRIKVGEGDTAAEMIVVYVQWSDPRWNNQGGISEESPYDLELIQSVKQKS